MIHDSESGVYCTPLKGMLFCSARQLNYQRTFFHMPDLKRVFVGAGQSRFWPLSSGTTFLDCGWTSALLHPVSLLWAWVAASPSPAQPLTLSSQTWSSCSWFRLPEGVSARAFWAKDPQEVPGRVLGPSFARRSPFCVAGLLQQLQSLISASQLSHLASLCLGGSSSPGSELRQKAGRAWNSSPVFKCLIDGKVCVGLQEGYK